MKVSKEDYIDFGAPTVLGAHIFRVEIPTNRNSEITIIEDFGYRGAEDGILKEEERIILRREIWTVISDVAKREFNDRLKAAKLSTARWHSGINLLDRLLGKELCVLAWAAEMGNSETLPIICTKWAALRPEERWWLFSMTVAENGLPEDTDKGWRKALFYALSETAKKMGARRRRRPTETDLCVLPLFNLENYS